MREREIKAHQKAFKKHHRHSLKLGKKIINLVEVMCAEESGAELDAVANARLLLALVQQFLLTIASRADNVLFQEGAVIETLNDAMSGARTDVGEMVAEAIKKAFKGSAPLQPAPKLRIVKR